MAITPVDFQRREPRDSQRTTTASFNLLLEQSRQSAQTFLKTGAGRVPIVQTRSLTIFPCKNTSDADLIPGQILGIDDILIAPADNESEFEYHPSLSGVEPTVADHVGKFVIAIECIGKTNGIGQVAVAGVVPARVYVNGVDDKYCDVIAMETVSGEDCYLGTGGSGAQILWRENAGSGASTIVWAIVRLGAVEGGALLGKLDGSLSVGGSATVSVWAWNGSSFADTGQNITAYDWLMKAGSTAIAAGKKVVCQSINGIYIVTEAECA